MANAGTLEFDIRSNYKDALDGLDKVGRKLEKFGRDVIEISGVMTAFGGVMVNEAAKYDTGVAKAVDNLKGSYARLSIEIGKTLAPAVEEAANLVEGLANGWRSLDKESKEAIQTAFRLAVQIGAVAAALSLMGKGFGLLADVGSLFAAMISPVGAFAAAILTSGVAVLYLVGAYDRLKASGKSLFEGLMSAGLNYAKFIGNLLSGNIVGAVGNLASLKKDVDEFGFSPQQMTQDFVSGVTTALHTIAPGLTEALKKAFSTITGATSTGKGPSSLGDLAKEDEQVSRDLAKFLEASRKSREEMAKTIAKYRANNPTGGPNRINQLGAPPKNSDKEAEEREKAKLWSNNIQWLKDWDASMTEAGDEAGRMLVDSVKDIVNGLQSAAGRVVSSLGKAGGIISNAMSSYQQTGSYWGAIISVIVDLVTTTKGWGRAVAILDRVVDDFVTTMEPIGELVEMIAGAIEPITDASAAFSDATFEVIPVMKILATIFAFVGVSTKNTFGLVNKAVGELIYFIGKVLGNKTLIGAGLNLEQAGAAMLEEAKKQWNEIPDIWNRPTEAANEAAKALDKFSESLTNVPTGFRVEAARFNATDMGPVHGASPVPGGGPGGESTRNPNAPPPPGVPGGWADGNGLPPSPPNRTAPVQVEVTIDGDLAPLIERIAVRQRQEAARERSNRDGRYRNAYSDAGGAY